MPIPNPNPLPLPLPIVFLDPDVQWLQAEGAYLSSIAAAASGLKTSESDIAANTNFNTVYANQFTTPFTAIDATSSAIFTTPTRPTDDASKLSSIASRLQTLIGQNAQLAQQLAAAQGQVGAPQWAAITLAQVPADVSSGRGAGTPPAGTPTAPGHTYQSSNGCWYSEHLNVATNPPSRQWHILQPCVPSVAVGVPNPVHAPAPPPAASSGMSTGTKIGLAVAGLGVIVLGAGAYFYFRDRREERA